MWIEEQSNGKYKYCERYKEPLTGKTKKVSMIYDKKGPKAEKLMRARLQEKIDEKLYKPIYLYKHFSDLLKEYEEYYISTVKYSTYLTMQYKFKLLYKNFGTLLTEQLIPGVFNKFLISLAKNNNARTTISAYRSVIKNVLIYAYNNNYINEDIALHIKMPKYKIKQKKDISNKYLEKEEVRLIIDYFNNNNKQIVADAIEFQVLTGLRFGKLSALMYDDFNDMDSSLNINKTYNPCAPKEHRISSPKTAKSNRTIFLNERCVQIIKSRKVDNLRRELAFKKFSNQNFIFANRHGNPYAVDACDLELHKAMQYIDINKHITTHIFRHTHISLLSEQQVPLNVIMERVGHSNPITTQEIYTHVTDKMKEDSKKQIQQLKII